MKKIPCRLILPTAVFALTSALLYWGHVEEREFWASNSASPRSRSLRTVLDYMPTGRRVAYMLSFPSALLTPSLYPFLLDRAQSGPPPSRDQLPFLVAVPFLWYWVGSGLDRYRGLLPCHPPSPRRLLHSAFFWFGFLASGLTLGLTIRALFQGHVPLLTLFLGALLWSLALSIHFLRQILHRPYRRFATD